MKWTVTRNQDLGSYPRQKSSNARQGFYIISGHFIIGWHGSWIAASRAAFRGSPQGQVWGAAWWAPNMVRGYPITT